MNYINLKMKGQKYKGIIHEIFGHIKVDCWQRAIYICLRC
jgi:hypothetical protein